MASRSRATWLRGGAVVLAVLIGAAFAHAHGGAPTLSPGMFHDWFQQQTNPSGQLCCFVADGRILRLDQVRQTDRGWEVQVPDTLPQAALMGGTPVGVWLQVPAENLVHTENPTGQPVAWFYRGEVRCFVPPPET